MATEPERQRSGICDRLKTGFFRQSFLMRLLLLYMLAASAFFLVLSWCVGGWWEGLFTDLAVTCLGVLLTVFLVERLQRADEAKRWSKVRLFALHEMKSAVTSSMRVIVAYEPDLDRIESTAVPWGYVRSDPLGIQKYYYDNPIWRKNVLEVAKTEIEPTPYEYGQRIGGDMPRVVAILDRSRERLQEVVSMFGDRLSPAQLELVWSFQRLCGESKETESYFVAGNDQATDVLPLFLAALLRLGVCIIEETETCDAVSVSIVPIDGQTP